MKLDIKDLKDLNNRTVVPMLAPMLQPYTKYIYWVLSGLLAILFLANFTTIASLSVFILNVILILIGFVAVRMLCEFLVDYPYPVTSNKSAEKEVKEKVKETVKEVKEAAKEIKEEVK